MLVQYSKINFSLIIYSLSIIQLKPAITRIYTKKFNVNIGKEELKYYYENQYI
jgi:hypothetical protein